MDAAAANLDEPPREVAYHRVTTNALLRAAQGLTAGVCVVHLIRAALRFVSYQDRKKMAAGLRRVYTAPTEQAARAEFDELAGSELGKRHPASIAVWQRAWERFTPFLASPVALRKIIYTTNAIWVLYLPAWAGRCFPDRSWKRPALTLNAIDAERLSWTRNVGLVA